MGPVHNLRGSQTAPTMAGHPVDPVASGSGDAGKRRRYVCRHCKGEADHATWAHGQAVTGGRRGLDELPTKGGARSGHPREGPASRRAAPSGDDVVGQRRLSAPELAGPTEAAGVGETGTRSISAEAAVYSSSHPPTASAGTPWGQWDRLITSAPDDKAAEPWRGAEAVAMAGLPLADSSAPLLSRILSNGSDADRNVDRMFGPSAHGEGTVPAGAGAPAAALTASTAGWPKTGSPDRETSSRTDSKPVRTRRPRLRFSRETQRIVDRERNARRNMAPSYTPSAPSGGGARVLNKRKVRVDTVYGPRPDQAAEACRSALEAFGTVTNVNTSANRSVGRDFFDCYAEFEDEAAAERSITNLHGSTIQDGLFAVRLMYAWDKPGCSGRGRERSSERSRGSSSSRSPFSTLRGGGTAPAATAGAAFGAPRGYPLPPTSGGSPPGQGAPFFMAAGPPATGSRWSALRTPPPGLPSPGMTMPVAAAVAVGPTTMDKFKVKLHALYGPTVEEATAAARKVLEKCGTLVDVAVEPAPELRGYFVVVAQFADRTQAARAVCDLHGKTVQGEARPVGVSLELQVDFAETHTAMGASG